MNTCQADDMEMIKDIVSLHCIVLAVNKGQLPTHSWHGSGFYSTSIIMIMRQIVYILCFAKAKAHMPTMAFNSCEHEASFHLWSGRFLRDLFRNVSKAK